MTSVMTIRLIDATLKEDIFSVMFLLSTRDRSLDVNGCDGNGDTALHLAAHRGNLPITLLLLQRGADVNVVNRKAGYTPLHRACWNGFLDIVTLLIEQGANVAAEDFDGYTPLHWAAWNGRIAVVEALIRLDAPLNHQDKYGYTPLHRACLDDGHAEICFLLLNFGANPNIQNETGETPLHLSCQRNHFELVRLLEQYRGNFTIKNARDQTPPELTKDERILQLVRSVEERVSRGDEFRKTRHSSFSALPKAFDIERLKVNRSSSLPADPVFAPPLTARTTASIRRRAIASWSIEDVCCWLRDIGLGAYQRIFVENELDGQSLMLLSEDDLRFLVPTPRHLQKLAAETKRLESLAVWKQQAPVS